MANRQRSFGVSYLRKKIKKRRKSTVILSSSSSDIDSEHDVTLQDNVQSDYDIQTNLFAINSVVEQLRPLRDHGMTMEQLCRIISFLFEKHCLAETAKKDIWRLMAYVSGKNYSLPSYHDFKKSQISEIQYQLNNYSCTTKSFKEHAEKCCDTWHGTAAFFDFDQSIKYIIKRNIDCLIPLLTQEGHRFINSPRYEKIWHQHKADKELIRLTLLMNMDDASMVRSNNTIVTPISYTIAELPLSRRCSKDNMMNACIYWGKERIKHDIFWSEAVIKPLEKYMTSPVSISIAAKDYKVMVKIGLVIMDSVAKPKTLNCMLFNSEFGCPYCLTRCESHQDHRDHNYRVYPYNPHTNLLLKTHQLYLDSAREASQEGRPVNGIIGSTILSNFIELPFQVPIDYMHACLEGIYKSMLNQRPFREAEFLSSFDGHVKILEIPHEFTRKVRPLSQLVHWKAHELRFCVLYLLPLFRRLDSDYFHIIAIFSIIIRLMINQKQSSQELIDLQSLINIFLESYQDLFGERDMKFNFHLLRHLPRQIEDIGNITEFSAFVYENNIYNLKRSFNGTRGQLHQISEAYTASKSVGFFDDLAYSMPRNELQICLPTSRSDCSRIIEEPKDKHQVDEMIFTKLKKIHPWAEKEHVRIFTRLKKDKTIFHSLIYSYRRTSASYYFSFKENPRSKKPIFGMIKYFIGIPANHYSENIKYLYVVYEKYATYESHSIFTNIAKPNLRKMRQILSFDYSKNIIFRVRPCHDHRILDFDKIMCKAMVFKDSVDENIIWASELIAMHEHD